VLRPENSKRRWILAIGIEGPDRFGEYFMLRDGIEQRHA
jgi:hypothetical protein